MSIKITLNQLIIANIILFLISFIFLEYSKMFRMSQEKHWIYSLGHNWWLLSALPLTFGSSIILGWYILWKLKGNKILYFLGSITPIILFLIFIILY